MIDSHASVMVIGIEAMTACLKALKVIYRTNEYLEFNKFWRVFKFSAQQKRVDVKK